LQIGDITGRLKNLANEIQKPIFLLSQLSRETRHHNRPTLFDLRESGAIEQDADTVFLMYYDEETGNTEIIVAKCREGEALFTINTRFNKEISTIYEIEPEAF
jgi:replicative DNA helicase